MTRPLIVLIATFTLWLLLLLACQRPPHSPRLGRAILSAWRTLRRHPEAFMPMVAVCEIAALITRTPAARPPRHARRDQGTAPVVPASGAVPPASYWHESAERLATGELLALARHASRRDGVSLLPPLPRHRITPLAAKHFARREAGEL